MGITGANDPIGMDTHSGGHRIASKASQSPHDLQLGHGLFDD
jgi:hypothetical protein